MKKTSRFLAVLLAFCVAAAAFPPAGMAAEGGTTHTITSGDDLYNYLQKDTVKDGDVIQCNGSIIVGVNDRSEDPWVIEKDITIQGGSLSLYRGGILLGADVTFKDTELHFTTPMHNAIIANGYALTLNGVTAGSSGYVFNVFCGTLLKNRSESFYVPSSGGRNMVTILGNTDLRGGTGGPANTNVVGNCGIYAGSLAMGSPNDTDNYEGEANAFAANPTICIEGHRDPGGGALPLGIIHAGGAHQTNPVGIGASKPTTTDPNRYTVNGTVTITGQKIPQVDGEGATATNVVYQGDDYPATKTFQDISSLSVESGKLALDSASWFRNGSSLTVRSGATVDIQNMGPVLSISDFYGGGSLILGQTQTLTITGAVEGETTVGVGKIFNGASDSPTLNRTYITAQNSINTSFYLAPPNVLNPPILKNDGSGNWIATAGTSGGEESKLVSLAPENTQVSSGETEIMIPLKTVYTTEAGLNLNKLPLTIQVNNKPAAPNEDGCYIVDNLGIYVGYYTIGDAFAICHADLSYQTPVPDGAYTIEITVPGEYTSTGGPITASCTLTVGSTPDPGPAAPTGLSAAAPTTEGGSDGKITGTTSAMEYAAEPGFSNPRDCGEGETAGLAAGTYYVRYKATDTQDASIAVPIIVPAYSAGQQPGGETHKLTVSRTGSGGTAPGDYQYAEGASVTVQAGARSGYTFSAWDAVGVTLANRGVPDVTFEMPAGDVTLSVIWRPNSITPPGHVETIILLQKENS